MATPPVMSQLENFLTLNNRREKIIASNMANVDTPGFHAQDMNFQAEFDKAMSTQPGNVLHVATHNVAGLVERADGNNVDLDREGLLLSETQLQYQLGTQLLKAQFHQLLAAINGDK